MSAILLADLDRGAGARPAECTPEPGDIRAEQVGVLARPARLRAAQRVHAEGRISDDGLRALEDQAVLDSLRRQADAGLHVFGDGQFRRRSTPVGVSRGLAAGAPRRRLAEGEVAFLFAHAPGPFKIAVPSPSSLAIGALADAGIDIHRLRTLLRQCSEAVRGELSALVTEGVRYVQLDGHGYDVLADPAARAAWRSSRTDPEAVLAECVDADNAALEAVPAGTATTAVRLSRPPSGDWLTSPDLEPIAGFLLRTLRGDRLLVDCDPRASESLDLLATVPSGRKVVLGLVDQASGPLPSYESLLARVTEAARYVPLDDLAVSTGGGNGHEADPAIAHERRALEVVGRLAKDVWL